MFASIFLFTLSLYFISLYSNIDCSRENVRPRLPHKPIIVLKLKKEITRSDFPVILYTLGQDLGLGTRKAQPSFIETLWINIPYSVSGFQTTINSDVWIAPFASKTFTLALQKK